MAERFRASVFTLYPDMFPGPLGTALSGQALGQAWSLDVHNIRDATTDKHRSVDDTPAGGGPGMVIRADILARSLDGALQADDPRPKLLLSPRGERWTQADARKVSEGQGVVLVCGRFEGVDQRVIDARGLREVSIGDYVLAGGELAAMVMLDSVIRLLPGVMGNTKSGAQESHESGLLEYPQYTRPVDWEGHRIPDILRSGDHAKIEAWRREQAEKLTRERRPDLWERYERENLS